MKTDSRFLAMGFCFKNGGTALWGNDSWCMESVNLALFSVSTGKVQYAAAREDSRKTCGAGIRARNGAFSMGCRPAQGQTDCRNGGSARLKKKVAGGFQRLGRNQGKPGLGADEDVQGGTLQEGSLRRQFARDCCTGSEPVRVRSVAQELETNRSI